MCGIRFSLPRAAASRPPKRFSTALPIARGAQFAKPPDLLRFERGIQTEYRGRLLLVLLKLIDAHHHCIAAFHGLLISVGGVLNLALDEPPLDSGQRTPHGIDAIDVFLSAPLDFISQLLDVIASPHRIGRVSDAGFVRDDLLRAEGQPRGFLGG